VRVVVAVGRKHAARCGSERGQSHSARTGPGSKAAFTTLEACARGACRRGAVRVERAQVVLVDVVAAVLEVRVLVIERVDLQQKR
jgi:hypothetical protein